MQKGLASIISATEVMPGAHLIWLESHQIAAEAKPGQFVMVRCGEESVLPRPFSIHRVDGDRYALLFRIVGKGTNWLAHRKAGECVELFGPLGNGFSIDPRVKNLLLAAGGMGIAPLVFLAGEMAKQRREITLLRGASSLDCHLPDEYLYTGTLNLNNIESAFNDIKLADDDSGTHKGLVTDYINETLADLAKVYGRETKHIYACGPLPMYKAMAKMPALMDKSVQVSLETRMGCGTGVCYGCTISTRSGLKQVCKDGPVFELSDVIWEEMTGV